VIMTSFKRARSEEQRTQRRRMILDTTAAMLAEMPVAHVSLNELSRRVGLAKSNVLRYFESREAVLLELLDAAELRAGGPSDAELDALREQFTNEALTAGVFGAPSFVLPSGEIFWGQDRLTLLESALNVINSNALPM